MLFNLRNVLFLLLFISLLHARAGYYEPWGKDAGIEYKKEKAAPKELSFVSRLADQVIRFHQEVISPVDGPRSHFRPSSSQYMQQAIYNYGFLKGFIMGCDRLLRENDEEWVYRKVEYEGKLYKFDPANLCKFQEYP